MALGRRSPAVDLLQEALTQAEAENATLQRRVAELGQLAATLQAERDDALDRVERVAAALSDLEQRVQLTEQRQHVERSRAHDEVASVRAESRSEVIELRAELEHTRELLAAQSAAAAQASEDRAELLRRAERAEAELVGMYAEVDVARAGQGGLRGRVNELETELDALTDLLHEARHALDQQAERAQRAEARAAAAETSGGASAGVGASDGASAPAPGPRPQPAHSGEPTRAPAPADTASAPDTPDTPDTPEAPEALEALEAPEAPEAPEATDGSEIPTSRDAVDPLAGRRRELASDGRAAATLPGGDADPGGGDAEAGADADAGGDADADAETDTGTGAAALAGAAPRAGAGSMSGAGTAPEAETGPEVGNRSGALTPWRAWERNPAPGESVRRPVSVAPTDRPAQGLGTEPETTGRHPAAAKSDNVDSSDGSSEKMGAGSVDNAGVGHSGDSGNIGDNGAEMGSAADSDGTTGTIPDGGVPSSDDAGGSGAAGDGGAATAEPDTTALQPDPNVLALSSSDERAAERRRLAEAMLHRPRGPGS